LAGIVVTGYHREFRHPNNFNFLKMMKKTLPIIQSLWIGDSLSPMEQLCISSFLENGHPYHLYTYAEMKGVPDGTTFKDANQIIHHDRIFKYKNHDSYSGFSDIFRYKLILEKGNYWVDTDFVCLVPFHSVFENEYIFSSTYRHKNNPENPIKEIKINCGVIKAPAGSEIMEFCYNKADKSDPKKLEWGEIGPLLIEAAVKRFDLQNFVVKPSTFCPIPSWHWRLFIKDISSTPGMEDSIKSILYDARAVHFWNELWRRNGADKNSSFPENSLYEQLKKRFLKED